MAQLTVEQRKFIVKEMIKHGSVITTIRRFQARCGTRLCKKKQRIALNSIASIDANTLQNVIANFVVRLVVVK